MKQAKKFVVFMFGNEGEIADCGEMWSIRTTQAHADAIEMLQAVDRVVSYNDGYRVKVSPIYDRDDIVQAIGACYAEDQKENEQ